MKVKGSAAINDAKGLYFINPKGEDKGKPPRFWTQGETEANSVWMVTIDKPNQKTTEEIYMTVPDKYVTLSNGLLKSQKKMRMVPAPTTGKWTCHTPHTCSSWALAITASRKTVIKGKEVSYYVEKEYSSVARKIFLAIRLK